MMYLSSIIGQKSSTRHSPSAW